MENEAPQSLADPDCKTLAAELTRTGWRSAPLSELGESFHVQTFQGLITAPCARFLSQTGQSLMIVDLHPVALPANDELFARFLDLPFESRMALSAVRLFGTADWLLLLTEGRLDLYRVDDEACACRVVHPEPLEKDLLPTLAALARGHNESVSGSGPQLPAAESLRDWLRHWNNQIASQLEAPMACVERMLWKWIVMLQLVRRVEGSEMAGGWGLRADWATDHWTLSYDPVSAVEDLGRMLDVFDQHFQTRLLSGEADRHRQWLERMETTSLPERLRMELLMQSQHRFESETVAWLFTDLNREQAGWRRELQGVAPMRERLQHDGWNIYRPLVLHVEEDGLIVALRDTERLAQYLADLSLFARQQRQAGDLSPQHQPDLFSQHPRGISLVGQLDDGLNFLFGEALRLEGVDPDRKLGVTMTFVLKALALSARLGWPFLGIDTIDQLFSPVAPEA